MPCAPPLDKECDFLAVKSNTHSARCQHSVLVQYIWELVKKLREEFGAKIIVTTNDMIEADTLCDRIAIMNKGRLAVVGTPSQLKSAVGGDVLTIGSRAPNLVTTLKELVQSSSHDVPKLMISIRARSLYPRSYSSAYLHPRE